MRRTWRSWARTSKNSIGIGHRMSSKMDGRRDRRGTLVEKGSKVTRVDVDLVYSTVCLVHVKPATFPLFLEIMHVVIWYWNASALVFTFRLCSAVIL